MTRLLLVEDDLRTCELVATFLSREGFEVHTERDGSRAVQRELEQRPDLVVLDWMLPGQDGVRICRQLRAEGYAGPVLLLTARTDEVDQIVGLEEGADDNLPKPVRPRLLLARIRALLRRRGPPGPASKPVRHALGWLVVDRGRSEVTVAEVLVPVSTAEFALLWLLCARAGSPVSRDLLFEELRGIAYDGVDRSMDMRVSQPRRRLVDADSQGHDPIRTVRGQVSWQAHDADGGLVREFMTEASTSHAATLWGQAADGSYTWTAIATGGSASASVTTGSLPDGIGSVVLQGPAQE